MSVASQFFPSGGGGTSTPTPTIKTNMFLVGGGGGGNPASPILPCLCGNRPCQAMSGTSGGGGGAGEAYIFKKYAISSGAEIIVTVGSGGATSSNGGSSSICITNENLITASGGKGTAAPCSSFEIIYSSLENASYGAGNGGRSAACYCPSPTAPAGGCSACCPSSSNSFYFCGLTNLLSSPSPTTPKCIFNYGDDGISVKGFNGGGSIGGCMPGLSSLPVSGGGGGGGGGSTRDGSSGCLAAPGSTPTCTWTCYLGGAGGDGGQGLISDILGSTQCFAFGGGGGGGNTSIDGPLGACCISPTACAIVPAMRSAGGNSASGGCGGQGSLYGANYPTFIPLCNGCPGCNATANTGGGGGGGGWGWYSTGTGGNGGSGVVVIQYPTSYPAAPAFPGACNCSPSTPGCYTYKFNGPGSITLP